MKTATVRDLRNRYTELLAWLTAGQEILITQRGKPIARLVPEQPENLASVKWSQSPAMLRDRRNRIQLPADQVEKVLNESSGRW